MNRKPAIKRNIPMSATFCKKQKIVSHLVAETDYSFSESFVLTAEVFQLSRKTLFLTGWWTSVFCCQDAYVGFRRKCDFGIKNKIFFSIFIPGLWSPRFCTPGLRKFLLADSTYKVIIQQEIYNFNSMLLKNSSMKNPIHYHFAYGF